MLCAFANLSTQAMEINKGGEAKSLKRADLSNIDANLACAFSSHGKYEIFLIQRSRCLGAD